MTKQKVEPWRNLAHFLNGITEAPALEKCIAWVDGLCEAVQDAHDEGKAYGWLVPQRISFRVEGELKFGFQLRLTPMQVGQWYPNIESDPFFPPELEYHPLCYESDVFGVASLLYTLLVGYPPEFLPPPPLGEGEEEQEFFHELSQVLQHALMPEPELRYHDLFAFRGALYFVLEGWGLSIFEEGAEVPQHHQTKDVSSIPGLPAAAAHQLNQVPGFAYPQGQPTPPPETVLIEPVANYQLLEHSHPSPPSTSSKSLWFFSALLLLVMLGGGGFFAYIQYKRGVFSTKPPDVNMQGYSQLRGTKRKAPSKRKVLAGTPKQPLARRDQAPSTGKESTSTDAGVALAVGADEPAAIQMGQEALAAASTDGGVGGKPVNAEEPSPLAQVKAGHVDAGLAKPMLAAEAGTNDAGGAFASPDAGNLGATGSPDDSIAGGPPEAKADTMAPGGTRPELTQPDAGPVALAPQKVNPDSGAQAQPDLSQNQPDLKAPAVKEGADSLDGGSGAADVPEADGFAKDAGPSALAPDQGSLERNLAAPDSNSGSQAGTATPDKGASKVDNSNAAPSKPSEKPSLVAAEPSVPDAGSPVVAQEAAVPEKESTPETPSEAAPSVAPQPRVAQPSPVQPSGPSEKVAAVDAGPSNPGAEDAGSPPEPPQVVVPDSQPTQVAVPEKAAKSGPSPNVVPEKAPAVRPAPRRVTPPKKVAPKTPCKADWIYIEVPKAWDDDTDVSVEKGKVVRKPKGFCIAPNSKRVLIEREEYAQCVFATPTSKTKWIVNLKREGLSLLEPNYCLKK
ncbi:MAG: hypothetical protein EP343_27175 [Deltaproteobacteria bacterium]|nr:MAG: hypothetical protein EP343_27175 [Deltaproteobacteria bacterium]